MTSHKKYNLTASELRDRVQSTLYLLDIGGAELSTLLALLDSSSTKDETVFIASSKMSYSEVALRTNKAVATIRGAIRSLVAHDYVSCYARPGDTNITLVLLEPIALSIQKRADECGMFWIDFHA